MFNQEAAAVRAYQRVAQLIDSYDETLRLIRVRINQEIARAVSLDAARLDELNTDLDLTDRLREQLREHGRGGNAGVASQRLLALYAKVDTLAAQWPVQIIRERP